ncbi:hypothetical protein A260_23730, partial [Pseudomonas syringae pv. actinidiae ICMP 19068]
WPAQPPAGRNEAVPAMTISPLRLALFLLVVGLLTWCAFEYQGNQLVAARADLADATADLHTEREAARLARDQLA